MLLKSKNEGRQKKEKNVSGMRENDCFYAEGKERGGRTQSDAEFARAFSNLARFFGMVAANDTPIPKKSI